MKDAEEKKTHGPTIVDQAAIILTLDSDSHIRVQSLDGTTEELKSHAEDILRLMEAIHNWDGEWNSDSEDKAIRTLSAENELLRREVADLRDVLREVEWNGSIGLPQLRCPYCTDPKSLGHDPLCPLAALLRKEGDGDD